MDLSKVKTSELVAELEMISTKVEKEGKTQAEAQTHRPL